MWIEAIGWAGSLAVLGGYALLSSGRVTGRSFFYHLLNIGGAIGMMVNGWVHHALPSVFTNLVWMTIGVVALTRLTLARRQAD